MAGVQFVLLFSAIAMGIIATFPAVEYAVRSTANGGMVISSVGAFRPDLFATAATAISSCVVAVWWRRRGTSCPPWLFVVVFAPAIVFDSVFFVDNYAHGHGLPDEVWYWCTWAVLFTGIATSALFAASVRVVALADWMAAAPDERLTVSYEPMATAQQQMPVVPYIAAGFLGVLIAGAALMFGRPWIYWGHPFENWMRGLSELLVLFLAGVGVVAAAIGRRRLHPVLGWTVILVILSVPFLQLGSGLGVSMLLANICLMSKTGYTLVTFSAVVALMTVFGRSRWFGNG